MLTNLKSAFRILFLAGRESPCYISTDGATVAWQTLRARRSSTAVHSTKNWNRQTYTMDTLKEYYEIVDEALPLSGFFPHTCSFFFTEMHF